MRSLDSVPWRGTSAGKIRLRVYNGRLNESNHRGFYCGLSFVLAAKSMASSVDAVRLALEGNADPYG